MNEPLLHLALAAAGQIFLFALFAALDHQKRRIGGAAMNMTFCATLLFGCMATAAGLRLPLPGGGSANYALTVIQLPLLAAFLLVFITRGVLESQRLLIGAACSYLLFIYFGAVLKLQCTLMPETQLRAVLFSLLGEVRGAVNFNAVSGLLAFLTVPMFYPLTARLRPRFVRVAATLTGGQLAALVPVLAVMRLDGRLTALPGRSLLTLFCATLMVSLLLAGYLRLLGRDVPEQKAGVFDFLFAFFGSYGRIRELEEDISGWENRYRLVLQQTAEVVVMSDAAGRVSEANIAAVRLFGVKNLVGRDLFALFTPEAPDTPVTAAAAARGPVGFTCTANEGRTTLSASISPVRLKDRLLLVMVARDITAERRFAAEKAALTDQLVHAQRMESLGVLAGGIAHDFNNYIHAILGHADVALMVDPGNTEKTESHLRKITAIAEKAGKLTAQLLGFARQGKYHVVALPLRELLEECTALLDPVRIHGVTLKTRFPDRAVARGDQLQLQQVVMNLLINALDAMESNPGTKTLTLSAGTAAHAPLSFSPPPDLGPVREEEYVFFAVEDNGSGMDEATQSKIFEPFFTTKPTGQGTGMGLAMVYGTVSHHKGWIRLKSEPGTGTLFCVFLPGASD